MKDAAMCRASHVRRAGGRAGPAAAIRHAMLCALLVLCVHGPAGAHDLFTSYVQHRIAVTAGPRHIDVVVDLTFFEEWSARERGRMDADSDGRITKDERAEYLKQLAPELCRQVRLRVGGREVELMPLYDPELDLLDSETVGPDHHRLRIWLFAPTPEELRPGAEILVEDRLWPQARALGAIEAAGRDGVVLEARKPKDPAFPPARAGEARGFEARCIRAPVEKPG